MFYNLALKKIIYLSKTINFIIKYENFLKKYIYIKIVI